MICDVLRGFALLRRCMFVEMLYVKYQILVRNLVDVASLSVGRDMSLSFSIHVFVLLCESVPFR